MKIDQTKYKVSRLSEVVETYGMDTIGCMLLGSGNFIVMEFDEEIGWFPMCGENRFKHSHSARQAITDRIVLNSELARIKNKPWWKKLFSIWKTI